MTLNRRKANWGACTVRWETLVSLKDRLLGLLESKVDVAGHFRVLVEVVVDNMRMEFHS